MLGFPQTQLDAGFVDDIVDSEVLDTKVTKCVSFYVVCCVLQTLLSSGQTQVCASIGWRSSCLLSWPA